MVIDFPGSAALRRTGNFGALRPLYD